MQGLESVMGLDSLSDPNDEELYSIKAKIFSVEEKIKLTKIIDKHTGWFNQYAFNKL